MQFINLEVVVAVLLFVGLMAFIALVYTSMRALLAQAAHTVAFTIGQASNIFHRLSSIALGYEPAATCSRRKAKRPG